MRLLIATACLHDNTEPIARFVESCEYLKLSYFFYGVKTIFKNWKQAKMDLLADELTKQDFDVVLYSDGFDSWMLKGEEDILKRFEKFNCDIVMSAEQEAYPLREYDYPPVTTSFRYPCAGQFMGKKQPVIDALRIASAKYSNYDFSPDNIDGNDQGFWQAAYLDKLFNMKLDSNCEIFLAAGSLGRKDVGFEDGEFVNRETKTYPCSIHFNGPKGVGTVIQQNMDSVYKEYLEKRK